MSRSREAGAVAAAHERIRDLLLAAHRGAEPDPERGYVDLLGTDRAAGSRAVQSLMRSRMLPGIYEWLWRPVLTRAFGGLAGPGAAEEMRIARLLLGLSPGDGVLDVGCGPGNVTRGLVGAVGEDGVVVGLDASAPMLEQAARDLKPGLHDPVTLIRADATSLPFRDQSFDGVCCFATLYLIEDPMAALDEMTRVLTRGGRIALMASVRRPIAAPSLKPVVRAASGVRIFEREEIVDALARRGFVEVHQRISGLVQFVGGRLAG